MMMSRDPISGRMRSLMPRPFGTTFSTIPTDRSLHNPKPIITSWTQPQSKREIVSSRWNPTPEQVQALEEMYRRGIRTPSADQIQQIAAKLRRFGKIEGKNVFYWFQNHKARDRQKKRRQLDLLHIPHPNQSAAPGLSRKYLEIDQQPKKVPTMSKCSTASKYQLELQQQSTVTKNTTTETSSLGLSTNVSMKTTSDQHQMAPGQENVYPFVALNLNKLMNPMSDDFGEMASGIKENRTLELFPVRSNGLSLSPFTKEEMTDVSGVGNKLVPNQFFEFLPTKN